jgi:hypothetical protein
MSYMHTSLENCSAASYYRSAPPGHIGDTCQEKMAPTARSLAGQQGREGRGGDTTILEPDIVRERGAHNYVAVGKQQCQHTTDLQVAFRRQVLSESDMRSSRFSMVC